MIGSVLGVSSVPLDVTQIHILGVLGIICPSSGLDWDGSLHSRCDSVGIRHVSEREIELPSFFCP